MSSLVVFDISLSLDGYMRGPNPRSDNVLGDGGEQLHAWASDQATDADRKLLEDAIRGAGAVICGRRTYNDSLPSWRADGPTGPARRSDAVLGTFGSGVPKRTLNVLTHRPGTF